MEGKDTAGGGSVFHSQSRRTVSHRPPPPLSFCLSSSHLLSLSASLRKGVMGVFSCLIYHKCNNLAITLPESLLFSSAIYSCYLHSASSLVFLFFHSPSLDTNTICHSVTEPVKQRKPLRLSTFRLEQELKDVEGCNDTTQP